MGAHIAVSLLALTATLQPEIRAQRLLGGAIEVCSRNDPDLDECIVNSLNNARDALANGVPDLSLTPLRELELDEFTLKAPHGLVGNMSGLHVKWTGLENFTVTGAKINRARSYIEINSTWPKMNFRGIYKGAFVLYQIIIRDEGTFTVDVGKIKATHGIYLETVKKPDGNDHWHITRYSVDPDFAEFKTDIARNAKDRYKLGRTISNFINTHWKEENFVRNIVRGAGLGNAVKNLANVFLDAVPLNQLLSH